MKSIFGKVLFKVTRFILKFLGYNVAIVGSQSKYPELKKDYEDFCNTIFSRSLTLTSLDSLKLLAICCEFVKNENLKGDFVEAGVWRGGSALIAKKILDDGRVHFLYDTYEGMTEPNEFDFRVGSTSNKSTLEKWNSLKTDSGNKWVAASLDEVVDNFKNYGLYDDLVAFIKGDVRETLLIEKNLPKEISLLRLDTDFYDSTLIELKVLWPRLVKGGILILDDYGHWDGARRAVDEFFSSNGIRRPLMTPIAGGGGRVLVKN